MNILFVNAFGNSPNGKTKFYSFSKLVKNIFKKISQSSGVDNVCYFYTTPNTISNYIFKYDLLSGNEAKNKQNKRNFDKIDIVFIDGMEKYVPWGEYSYLLCEFIKLCKLTNKVLYAGGVALEILVYYLATGSLNEYNFINSKGEIRALEEINKIPSKFFKEIKKDYNFLDFVTGDILEYRSNEKTWVPIKNIGLHKQIIAEKYMSRGKFVLPDKFKGKDSNKNKSALVTFCHEIKVSVTRQYLSHYLMESLPLEFVAYTSLTWYIHYYNVSDRNSQIKVLCESERGPVVIEHENSTGVAFHPQEKLKDSSQLLENYIRKNFFEVRDKIFRLKTSSAIELINLTSNETPKLFKNYKLNDENKAGKKKLDDLTSVSVNSNLEKVNNSRAFNRIKKVRNEAGHVGFGLNNRDMIFVENNFINQVPIFYLGKQKTIQPILNNEELNLQINNPLHSMKRINSSNKKPFYVTKTSSYTKIFHRRNNDDYFDQANENKPKVLNPFLSYGKKNRKTINLKYVYNKSNKTKDNYEIKNKLIISKTNNYSKTMTNYNKFSLLKFINNKREGEINSPYPNINGYNTTKHNSQNKSSNYLVKIERGQNYIPKYPRPLSTTELKYKTTSTKNVVETQCETIEQVSNKKKGKKLLINIKNGKENESLTSSSSSLN